ncbi:GNAT family N-acetyltransferase [Bacillus sp. V59.32b]|uniref:GNAT family N-acetyltransferase n=1 Tax=Bacillus sp. V59.32b TaxID=1758642 RepID=UPI00267DFC3F
MFPIIETTGLILRDVTEKDAEDLFEYFSQEKVMSHYGQEAFERIEDIQRLIA